MNEVSARRSGLRRFFPDSLVGQLMLALLACILLLQATNFQVVCEVQEVYVRQAEKNRAENLAAYWFMFNTMTPEQREIVLSFMADARRPEQLREMIEFLPQEPDWGPPATQQAERLTNLVYDSLMPGKKTAPTVLARIPENVRPSFLFFRTHLPMLETAISLSDGTWLKVTQPLDVDDRFVVWMQRFFVLLESVVIVVLALWLLIRVTRPLRRLSETADSFGKQPEMSEPLPETGSREIREAAQSFNRMRKRICDNLAERGRLLAAMAHDLRTPLTRAQLRLDKVEPEKLREEFGENLKDIKSILNQGLELAGSLTTAEEMSPLNLEAFMQSIVDDCVSAGGSARLADIDPSITLPIIVSARPLCLTRCVNNLISNACKYGENAEVVISENEDRILVDIRDHGPGIPEDKMDQVFEPYYRLENSRSRDTGGTGLGLSIARNMALLNGSGLELSNLERGLQARLILQRHQV